MNLKNEMLDRSKISANAVDELQRSQAFHDAVECLPVDRFEADFYGCKVAGQGMTVGIFNGNIGGTDDLDDFQQNPFPIPGLDVEGVFLQFFLFKVPIDFKKGIIRRLFVASFTENFTEIPVDFNFHLTVDEGDNLVSRNRLTANCHF